MKQEKISRDGSGKVFKVVRMQGADILESVNPEGFRQIITREMDYESGDDFWTQMKENIERNSGGRE